MPIAEPLTAIGWGSDASWRFAAWQLYTSF
jgi:hypothetical protein